MDPANPDDCMHSFDWLLGSSHHRQLRIALNFGSGDQSLSDFERLAIWTYTTAAGGHHALYNGAIHGPEITLLRSLLCSAIAKCPAFEGPVFRSIRVASEAFDGLAACEVGHVFVWDRFTNTTTDQSLALTGNVRMLIRSRLGRVLGYFSSMIEEREILFPPQSRFAIKSSATVMTHEEVLLFQLEETQ